MGSYKFIINFKKCNWGFQAVTLCPSLNVAIFDNHLTWTIFQMNELYDFQGSIFAISSIRIWRRRHLRICWRRTTFFLERIWEEHPNLLWYLKFGISVNILQHIILLLFMFYILMMLSCLSINFYNYFRIKATLFSLTHVI